LLKGKEGEFFIKKIQHQKERERERDTHTHTQTRKEALVERVVGVLFCIFFISFRILGWIFKVNSFYFVCLGFGAGWGVGGVGYVFFFSLSNNSVLFAVLFFLQKSFVLDCRVQGL
jgi:uncharacterized membrane protein